MQIIAEKKLKEYENNLIETDRRNNLINFKTTNTVLKVVYPNLDDIYSNILSGRELIITTVEDILKRYKKYYIESHDRGSGSSYESLINLIEKNNGINDEIIKDFNLIDFFKDDEIIVYNQKSNLRKESDNTLLKIGKIIKDANDFIKEKGIYVLHIALGFIKWKEISRSNEINISPITILPIEITQESKSKPYKIKLSDDKLEINPSLNYKFNDYFGIDLSENVTLENNNLKNNGIEDLLKELDKRLMPLKDKYDINYELLDDCYIGIFKTNSISMYLDIKDNHQKILNNQNILKILGESSEYDSSYIHAGTEHKLVKKPLVDLHNVVNADSSQITAINRAKSGESFILMGPPGTGKSQTITNIIAESIYDGKKVLFVSQKLAALEVVRNNLDNAGLSDFYLDMFDKITNKSLLSNVNKLLDKAAHDEINFNSQYNKKLSLQEELDKYKNLVNEKDKDTGMSLYDYYGEFSRYRDNVDIDEVLDFKLNNKNDYLDQAKSLIESFQYYAKDLGYDYKKSPRYGYIVQDDSPATKKEAKENIEHTIEFFHDLKNIQSELLTKFNLEAKNLGDILKVNEIFNYLSVNKIIINYDVRLNGDDDREIINILEKRSRDIMDLKEEIDNDFTSEIYDMDTEEVHFNLTEVYNSKIKRLFKKSEYSKILYDIGKYNKNNKVTHDEAISITQKIIKYNRLNKEFKENELLIKDLLGYDYNGIQTDRNALKAQENMYNFLKDDIKDVTILNKGNIEDIHNSLLLNSPITMKLSDILSHEDIFKETGIYFDKDLFDMYEVGIDEVIDKFQTILDDYENLTNWNDFRTILSNMGDYKILPYIDKLIDKNIEIDKFVDTFLKSYYNQMINEILNNIELLRVTNRYKHEETIKEFKKLDKEDLEIHKAEIQNKLYSKIKTITQTSRDNKYSFLKSENNKKRNIKKIREIISEAGNEILELKPCFLISPLNVSTYLDPEKIHFDLVIFDEASQIFPRDAIGSIYRAKQAIIVGDPKQMPPSDYFRAVSDNEYEDSLSEVNDYESILDICAGAFKTIRLNWHYRSKYEELIAFSNKNFYDGKLLTFPSTDPKKVGEGVEFFYVDSRISSANKNNIKEAQKVVELVYEHFKNYPEKSLGVISLNSEHADLIEKLLLDKRIEDNSCEELFSEDKIEPFFLKKLETVQGDERDTIIFSIGYAKDQNDKLRKQFGPLSREGGERRLNVAVSRAKTNIKVVSSLHSYDIEYENLKNEGGRFLSEYLDYAEHGVKALDRSMNISGEDHFDSPFEEEVCTFLRENGYSVDTQVGVSDYKIDMGLKLKDTSKYVLAIECDGRTYHSAKNARDRDILRQEILENLGWKFYRIRSTDRFRNNKKEKENLLKVCEKAIEEAKLLIDEEKNNLKEENFKISDDNEDNEFIEAKVNDKVEANFDNTTNINTEKDKDEKLSEKPKIVSKEKEKTNIYRENSLKGDLINDFAELNGKYSFISSDDKYKKEDANNGISYDEFIPSLQYEIFKNDDPNSYVKVTRKNLYREFSLTIKEDAYELLDIILYKESPILEKDLFIRLNELIAKTYPEKYFKSEFYDSYIKDRDQYITIKDGFIYLDNKKIYFRNSSRYKREIPQIAPEELAMEIKEIKKNNRNLSVEEIADLLARKLDIGKPKSDDVKIVIKASNL